MDRCVPSLAASQPTSSPLAPGQARRDDAHLAQLALNLPGGKAAALQRSGSRPQLQKAQPHSGWHSAPRTCACAGSSAGTHERSCRRHTRSAAALSALTLAAVSPSMPISSAIFSNRSGRPECSSKRSRSCCSCSAGQQPIALNQIPHCRPIFLTFNLRPPWQACMQIDVSWARLEQRRGQR